MKLRIVTILASFFIVFLFLHGQNSGENTEKNNKHLLKVDLEKKEIWLKKLLQETELQISKYDELISKNKEARKKETDEFKKTGFHAVQREYGYFSQSSFYVDTAHYNPTLLQGIIDLSEKCKSYNTVLIVIPCISMQEYSRKELIKSMSDFPFADYGREKFVYDCLKNGILAVDTNAIIRKHQTKDYLPYSLSGDNLFSNPTAVFIADEIASNLGIKRNEFKMNKGYFTLNSMHLPYYSGPSTVLTQPVFETKKTQQDDDSALIMVTGDSFATSSNFHNYISSLTLSNIKTVRYDARPNTTLRDLLDGKYDSDLQKSSLVFFVFYSQYMTANYPTKELVESQLDIKDKKKRSHTVPITDSPKVLAIQRPDSFSRTEPIKAIIETSAIMAKYKLQVNNDKTVFDYDCHFPYNGGDNSFVIDLDPKDFIDGQVTLKIDGNTSFKKVTLVDPSDIREPFKHLYKKTAFDTVCFEGTIRRTSTIPDPKTNDYDNCLYALFVELDSVLSNTPLSEKMPCEAIITVPIMKDKRLIEENIFYPGDRIQCVCAEYDAMPLEIQRIQLSDDIQAFDHQQFYTTEIARIKSFSTTGNRNFAKRVITFLPIQTLPKDDNAAKLRKERINNEISRIEKELKKHGGSFESWKKEYKPIGEKYKKLCEEGWKGWINDSYFAAYGSETTYLTKIFIEGILPYKKYLEEHNIDLIFLRVPTKNDFAARVLTSDGFQENPAWVEHYYKCLKNDIEIIDPLPEMWKHRFDYPLFYFFHPDSEDHPFEGQAFISASVLSDVLKRYSFSTSDTPIEIEDYSYPTKEERYFWPKGNDKFDPNERIVFKRVVRNKETIGTLSVNSGSPFLFLSNSFFWFPRGTQGASIPGYTAYLLQHIPDWFYQDGTSNPLIRMLVSSPDALQKRRAVIMVGHAVNWITSVPTFPKYLLDNPESISLEKTIDFSSTEITNLDNGSFIFKQEKGITSVSPNKQKEDASKSFEIELSIPKVKDKDTCMLRINFDKTTFLSIFVKNPDTKKIIDSATLSLPNKITQIDLSPTFIIPSEKKQKVVIQIAGQAAFSVKNIELWYY